MKDTITAVIDGFASNRASVNDLVNLDRQLIDLFLSGLRDLATDLREKDGLLNASRRIKNRVSALEAVRNHDSLRRYYKTMFNQCVVLLVSYFASAVHDLFRRAAGHAFSAGRDIPAAAEDIRLAWRDFPSKEVPPNEVFADLLVVQKDISLQDMQSIGRAFVTHFGLHVERNAEMNDLILGQAARHVIVHNGGVVGARMLRQLENANPHMLKSSLNVGELLQFEPDEIDLLGVCMGNYLTTLGSLLLQKLDKDEAI